MRKANWAIDKVTTDMTGRFTFNTAIAAIMELVNEIYRHLDAEVGARRFAVATAASLLFPFAPHLGSEVYEMVTGRRVWEEPWPTPIRACCSRHVRARLPGQRQGPRPRERPSGAPRDELERLCMATRGVQAHVDGHEVAKVIVVPDKLVNVVVR